MSGNCLSVKSPRLWPHCVRLGLPSNGGKRPVLILCFSLFLILLFQCKKAPDSTVKGPQWQLVPQKEQPTFSDGYSKESMMAALEYQFQWFQNQPADKTWNIGNRTLNRDHMQAGLRRFRDIWLQNHGDSQGLRREIQNYFDVFQLQWNGRPDVLFTGYYAPIFKGSRRPSQEFRFPLYALPKDLVNIRPSLFDSRFLKAGETLRGDRVAARLDPSSGQVLPYYSRTEIDGQGALKGRNLELVYLNDYFQAFAFHVQGGGFVHLKEGGYLKLNYAGKNGRPYRSIGKLLVEEGKIPKAQISMQSIEAYFKKFPEEVKRVCFENESYVFYQSDGKAYDHLRPELFPNGVLNFPVTAARSIAMDKRYFPGGALAFISGNQRTEAGGSEPFSAFVLDQDTGGAIKRNHIDVFQGAGDEAQSRAGLLNDPSGRVFFLVLKKEPQG